MKFSLPKIAIGLSAIFLIASPVKSGAFALLGPYEPWMQTTNGLQQPESVFPQYGQIQPADIGGPMDRTNEYRWNVPVITYGFDQSFLDYFGTNGVTAVKSAIQVLNDLPSASSIVLTNFPLLAQHFNFQAQALEIYDLKSQTLSLLLEQLGLAQPSRYIYVLKQWDSSLLPPFPDEFSSPLSWPDGTIPEFIVQRNFDPETLEPSLYIDETLFFAHLNLLKNGNHLMVTFPGDPLVQNYPAVADFNISAGEFYNGLTRDDVGGLCYLLSTNNVNFETLLPGVSGVGANSNLFVNGAWRPGVDKITFVPQPVDLSSGSFLAYTNQFTDSYITNGILVQQQVARLLTKPDILFSVADFGNVASSPMARRTGTTNWVNNASLNGNPIGAGPGMIQPGITITFNKAGRTLQHDASLPDESVSDFGNSPWGSFDGSLNTPVIYPVAKSGTNHFTVRMWLIVGKSFQNFEWSPASLAGTPFAFQTSTNLINWTTSFVAINDGSVCTYFNNNPASPSRYYRLIQQ